MRNEAGGERREVGGVRVRHGLEVSLTWPGQLRLGAIAHIMFHSPLVRVAAMEVGHFALLVEFSIDVLHCTLVNLRFFGECSFSFSFYRT